jgi:GNAT superfamily N-acetyltransferase
MTDTLDNLVISSDCTGVDWYELRELIRRAPLGERDVETLKRAFTGSYLCAFAYAEGRLVGAARAISDGVTSSAIYDMVVDLDWQGKGVGKRIMLFLLERLPKSSVMLVSVPRHQEFYRRLGFKKLTTAYMRKESFDSWVQGGYFEE